jgi:SAM-dependent methyltransferase
VRALFGANARAWERIYDDEERLEALVYRQRHELALRWTDEVALPPGARILDVGCGAGYTAVALASRGYGVHALDVAPEMIALATTRARAAGLRALTAAVGDVYRLTLADASFDLVVALGVLPWLEAEARALAEMARVLKRGGWLIVTADSAAPLHRLIDPRATPWLAPLRRGIKRALGRDGGGDGLPPSRRHHARALRALVRGAGLETVRMSSVGFGRFTMLGRPLLSPRGDVAVQRRLQRLADAGWPLLDAGGSHHVVLARKQA